MVEHHGFQPCPSGFKLHTSYQIWLSEFKSDTVYQVLCAHIVQLAETIALEAMRCRFESCYEYQSICSPIGRGSRLKPCSVWVRLPLDGPISVKPSEKSGGFFVGSRIRLRADPGWYGWGLTRIPYVNQPVAHKKLRHFLAGVFLFLLLWINLVAH